MTRCGQRLAAAVFCQELAFRFAGNFVLPASLQAHFDPGRASMLRMGRWCGGDRFTLRELSERASEGATLDSVTVAICPVA
jgi:hypothetical protein